MGEVDEALADAVHVLLVVEVDGNSPFAVHLEGGQHLAVLNSLNALIMMMSL